MNTFRKTLTGAASLLLLATLATGCGSSARTTVDGYDDSMLNRKTVYVLLPDTSELIMNNSAAYAASRGVATDGAREMLGDELRTRLIESLDARLDSNTTLNYASQSISGIVPLNSDMFTGGVPKSWDNLTKAGRQGNFDYLIVLHRLSVAAESSQGNARGSETIQTGYSLLDVTNRRVMTSGEIEVQIKEPHSPVNMYTMLAEKLSSRLPFWVEQPK